MAITPSLDACLEIEAINDVTALADGQCDCWGDHFGKSRL